jgi:transposase
MPWHTRNLLEEREAFIRLAESADDYFSRLCQSFGISRNTGYKWLSRYRQSGNVLAALKDQSRRPHRTSAVGERVELEVLRCRAQYGWGPHKLAPVLRADGTSIGHSTIYRILKKHGRIPTEDPHAAAWIHELFVADDPQPNKTTDIQRARPLAGFAEHLSDGCLSDRKKAIAVVARLRGIPLHTVAECLRLTPKTVLRYSAQYAASGVEELFCKRKSKINDDAHQGAVFALLHSPPSSSGINRTTWKMADLHRVLGEKGHRLSENRIRRIIKAGGYRWRRARVVLTSNDPDYETKLKAIKEILANLTPDQAFFSIDEYGPFAIKQKPGRKLVEPDTDYTVQQWQKSKGWTIITAALELSRNQVTHFYSRRKDTDEMIKMLDLLRSQYRSCSKIYLSWDAASWHISRKLLTQVEQINAQAFNMPCVELAPLPAGAQFLNVIESIFSGMSKAIIHNSDYPSLEAAKAAIDRYFAERNTHFAANPKRAGCKIWGEERVPSRFDEAQNCKDPAYR